ncbi:hypothetical protein [Pontibacter ruber]|uniref:Type II toxin-antitoxin system RelE/ParE family toxin n=1 Tax=Pontibacter ruber TaxID=1343895 RepID=A0ABW5CSV7_9BACT|nr:hypothetical protein [Pontibacter ruber]
MDFNLRPKAPEDLDSLVKYANNYNVARNMADVLSILIPRKMGGTSLP